MINRNQIVAAMAGAVFMSLSIAHADENSRKYPPAPNADVVDTYHGTKVPDPYRPLEDPDAPKTREWIDAENKITFEFLEKIPAREQLKKRLTALWDYEKFGVPFVDGGRYFYSRNTGLQNQSVLYWTAALDAEPRVLLDPNKLSEDGTVALAGTEVSDDGKLFAYGLASAGSDWQEWKVRDVESGNDREDHLKWIKFSSPAWTKDGKGFYYGRFPEPKPGEDLKGANFHHKLYYHAIGTPQSKDRLVHQRADEKEWQFYPEVSDDGKYLVVTVAKGTDDKYQILYKDLSTNPEGNLTDLIDKFENQYAFLGNDGPVFWFQTDRNAPRGKVIAIDTRNPKPENWKDIIPEAAETLEGVSVVGDQFFALYLKDAHSQVKAFDLAGKHIRDVELPGLGTAVGFSGKRQDRETFYAFTSFTSPTTVYRYDIASGKSEVFRKPKVDFKSDDYVTEQVFYSSKDGTKVPMFITHKKDLKRDGNNPTLLYGYGGFKISLTPWFSPANAVWLEQGGVLAIPNLRGGGEYGEPWHEAGKVLKKQNVFDDFQSAAQWLIDNKITSSKKLAIEGGSNGGLLVGACMNQRPDLFAAAIPHVGVMDMLRFHKFTIGWAWIDEYGSVDKADQFKTLLSYSPLHNVKPGTCYPATMIITADHDDRVVPAHSFKFAAAVQATQSCDNPILIRIETRAGHGAGKPTTKIIEEAADKWAFLTKVLEVPGR